jgi:DNA-binding MarR family transcriptional regulator
MNFTEQFMQACRQARAENLTAITVVHALALIGHSDNGATMTTVAEKVGFSTAACTSMIDQLEKMNLVRRDRDAKDRRIIIVRVTTEGLACLARIFPTK